MYAPLVGGMGSNSARSLKRKGCGEIVSQSVTIVNELGIHARPAAKIAEIASQAIADVQIIHDNVSADATSVLDVLMLACAKGAEIQFRISDPADVGVVEQLVKLIEDGFGE